MSDEQKPELPQLTEEQRQQMERAMEQLRGTFGRVSRVGCLGMIFRGLFGNLFRLPRIRGRRLVALGIGLLIATLSIVTCSAGVNLRNLTAEYGDVVPASGSAATRLAQRAAAAAQQAGSTRRFRITMTETEATSALSLGLLLPEVMVAMESMPPGMLQTNDDISEVRRLIREHRRQQRANRTFSQKVADLFDPNLRTGDVQVQFTQDGQIVMAGYIQAWRFRQPALVVFAPRARTGQLELNFVSGRLGRLPAPSWAFNRLGDMVTSLILQGREYAEISELTVTDGRMTFEARLTR